MPPASLTAATRRWYDTPPMPASITGCSMSSSSVRRVRITADGSPPPASRAWRCDDARATQEPTVPAPGGQRDRPGLVLEHPAGEVAPAPLAGVGEDGDRPVGAAAATEHPAEEHRHAMVGDQLAAHGVRGTGRRTSPPATIASAASRPVSSAWPMPSPVITSVAAAASPTNSTGPCDERRRVDAGRDRPRQVSVDGRRARAEGRGDVRPLEERRPRLLHVLRTPSRAALDAEADVGAAVRERERPGVAGQEVGVEPHVQLVARPGR